MRAKSRNKQWESFFSALVTGRRKHVVQIVVFIAGSIACGAYSVRLGAFNTWDMRNYQFYSPYALLNGRFDLDYAAAQIQTFLNPLPFVPFYAAVTHLKPVVAGFVMGGMHGLAAGLVFLIALTLFSSAAPLARVLLSLSCAALGIYGPTFIGMLGGSGNDNLLSPFVLAAVYVLIRGIMAHGAPDARAARKTLLISGLLFGAAAGMKLVCIMFLLGSGIAIFVAGRELRSRLTATAFFVVAGVVGFVLTRGYWMAFLWSKYDSPLFPFYNTIFDSPYYYLKDFADVRFIPKTLSGALSLPFHFATDNYFTDMSHHFRDIRYPIVYVLILLLLIALATKRFRGRSTPALSSFGRVETFLIVFFAVSYVIWQAKFAIMRYIVPLELLAPIVIAVVMRSLVPGRSLRLTVTFAVFVVVAVVMRPRDVPRQDWSSAYIDVQAPQLEDPSNTLIIIANNRPWAYVIPFFQPEVNFVGLCNNFGRPDPGSQHRATDEMEALVRSHRGQIYLLSNASGFDNALQCLQPLNIVQASEECLIVSSGHERELLCLLPVEVR